MEVHPLRFLKNLGRTREIVVVLLNHGFGDMVTRLHLRKYLRWGWRLVRRMPQEPERELTVAQRIRMSLESLGPSFVKFGQVISTRPDVVPAAVVEELSQLQERVPPFDVEVAARLVETELGAPLTTLFREFSETPLAAGSLAQVHTARLPDGTQVAVKIRRPNVVRDVERDLLLMQDIAVLFERHIPEAATFDPTGLVSHFARAIRREMNFVREGRSLDEFARLFRSDATLHVPQVFWDYTTDAVLTMEFIDGIHIHDTERMKKLGISPRELAANAARIYMKQAFEFGVFHGDPHPGNLRVMPDGAFCLLDYGMIGLLEEEKREQLVDLILAVTRQDPSTVVEQVLLLGQPFRPIDAPLLRADVQDFVATYYGVPLERLNMEQMLGDFVGLLSLHGIRCPGDLMLLIRTLVTLEGVGCRLDPEFNLAEHLTPFMERIARERYDPRRVAQKLCREMRTFGRLAHDLPLAIGRTIEKLSKDDLHIQFEHRRLERLITEIDRSSNRIVVGVVISSLVVSSALILRTGPQTVWLPIIVLVLSVLLGCWLVYGIFRSGRL